MFADRLQQRCSRAWSFARVTATAVAMLLCLTATAAEPEAKDQAATGIPARMVIRTVSKEDGKPLARAAIRCRIYFESAKTKETVILSDKNGEAKLELPAEPKVRGVRLDGKAEGRVPYHFDRSSRQQELQLPAEYTMAMARAAKMGGVVHDQDGKPVAGVAVNITYPATDADMNNYYFYLDRNLKTDAQGRWRSKSVPEDLANVQLRFEHPDYLADYVPVEENALALREESFETVMKRGPGLEGRVIDAAGNPIKGAKVLVGTSTYDSNKREVVTDEAGNFNAANCKEGPQFLCVTAEGHAPELQQVTIAEENEPVEIQLGAPATFRLRIVDQDGKPVAGAEPVPEHWRGQQMLRLRKKADAEGRWEWKDAPHDEVKFSILAGEKNLTMRDVPLTAKAEEQVVRVYPKFRIAGSVTDAASGDAIKEFQVFSAYQVQPVKQWDRFYSATFKDGKYEYKFDELRPGFALRVEAEGYQPAESPTFTVEDYPEGIDFVLHESGTIAALVKQPDGSPAKDATVVLLTASDRGFTQFSDGHFRENPNVPSMKTGDDGSYRFTQPKEDYLLVALHDSGYVDVLCKELDQAPTLTLKPWGRIEGTLKIGSAAGANKPIRYSLKPAEINGQPRLSHDYTTTTDAEGHFKIERVAPGEGWLSDMHITRRAGGSTHSPLRSELVQVEPGKVAQVTLGGKGRPVIGRAVAKKPDGSAFAWEGNALPFVHKLNSPGDAVRFYVPIAADGSFRGEDIPAGKYRISVQLTPPVSQDRGRSYDAIGSGSAEFTVPEMPEGRSDEPLDIGEVPITLFKSIDVGEEAPDFTLDAFDGRPISLIKLRGKVVLVDFWATWCGPCLAEMPNMKATHKAFGDNERFVMLGISIDETAEPAKQKVAADKYEWTQLWTGGGWESQVAKDYGVRAIPATFLIGPDGKVIAKDLRGEALQAAVKEALK